MENIFGHFPHSLMPEAYSQQMKVKVLRCSGVLSLKYGLAAGVHGAGASGARRGRVGGIAKLEEPVLRFCLFIFRSQQGSCLPLPPFGGSDFGFIFIWVVIEISFNVLT